MQYYCNSENNILINLIFILFLIYEKYFNRKLLDHCLKKKKSLTPSRITSNKNII